MDQCVGDQLAGGDDRKLGQRDAEEPHVNILFEVASFHTIDQDFHGLQQRNATDLVRPDLGAGQLLESHLEGRKAPSNRICGAEQQQRAECELAAGRDQTEGMEQFSIGQRREHPIAALTSKLAQANQLPRIQIVVGQPVHCTLRQIHCAACPTEHLVRRHRQALRLSPDVNGAAEITPTAGGMDRIR